MNVRLAEDRRLCADDRGTVYVVSTRSDSVDICIGCDMPITTCDTVCIFRDKENLHKNFMNTFLQRRQTRRKNNDA